MLMHTGALWGGLRGALEVDWRFPCLLATLASTSIVYADDLYSRLRFTSRAVDGVSCALERVAVCP